MRQRGLKIFRYALLFLVFATLLCALHQLFSGMGLSLNDNKNFIFMGLCAVYVFVNWLDLSLKQHVIFRAPLAIAYFLIWPVVLILSLWVTTFLFSREELYSLLLYVSFVYFGANYLAFAFYQRDYSFMQLQPAVLHERLKLAMLLRSLLPIALSIMVIGAFFQIFSALLLYHPYGVMTSEVRRYYLFTGLALFYFVFTIVVFFVSRFFERISWIRTSLVLLLLSYIYIIGFIVLERFFSF